MSPPRNAGYAPPPSYTDEDTIFSNNDLCPRYADADPSSAPPSPASVESFDILESIPWRRSYIAPGYRQSRARPCEALRARCKKNRALAVATALLVMLIIVGTTTVAYLALRDAKSKG
jgi:hypothetical protein